MAEAKGLVTVWLNVAPSDEQELNDWYDREHLAQVVALPGFVRARRYSVDDAPLKYLAWYETTDASVEPGPDFQRLLSAPTAWSQRMRGVYGENRERMNFTLMRDVGRVAETDTPWLYIVHTDIPDDIVGAVAPRVCNGGRSEDRRRILQPDRDQARRLRHVSTPPCRARWCDTSAGASAGRNRTSPCAARRRCPT